MACTSALSGLIACNQTLTIMLTDQLTHELIPNKEKLALNIEDTAVVISALIPWSIAGAVPIAAMGSTTGCLPFAFYLYLIPLWRIAVSLIKKHKK